MKDRSVFERIIPITLFNKGKASQLFQRAQDGEDLIVVKNNKPVAVILSIEEYKFLSDSAYGCSSKENGQNSIDVNKPRKSSKKLDCNKRNTSND